MGCTALRPEPSDEAEESHATPVHTGESTQDPIGVHTEEQLLIRERGLRILARLIVRAYPSKRNVSANHPYTDANSS